MQKIHLVNVNELGKLKHRYQSLTNQNYISRFCKYIAQQAAMVEWLRCSTRIHKVLCSNLSITIHGMTLNKSLTAQLSRMTHSYYTEYIISQYVARKGVQILPSVKRKRR